ncbi:MAG: hypothetical protein ACI93L_000887 [Cyclobacteriaceae bacterium]|jgi:uncharacterized protein (TIGR00255 family)
MLKSMTGFGVAEFQTSNYQIKVELKSLNSKFQDINVKLPRELAQREAEIKTLIGKYLVRGKIGCVVDITPNKNTSPEVKVNDDLFEKYFTAYSSLAKKVNAESNEIFKLALQSPNVIAAAENDDSVSFEEIKKVLDEALSKCDNFRQAEGSELARNLDIYITKIRSGLETVKQNDPKRVEQIKSRLLGHMEEVKEKAVLDPNRFEQEIIYYLEKLDITEEKVRLTRHLDYFVEVMAEKESQGKKLGFISQEIGREINTIGAKANHAEIQRAVVEMKDELEKIKEQSMNIL